MLVAAALLGLLALALAGPPTRVLATAGWPQRAPVPGLLLWQGMGLAGGLSAVLALTLLGLAPLADTVPAALAGLGPQPLSPLTVVALAVAAGLAARLLWVLACSVARTLRARRRHRVLVDLVTTPWPDLGGARVLESRDAVAYCLPGLRPRVVVSLGAVELLDDLELAAVLAHEQAHATQRHDLVVLPFVALGATFPRLRSVRAAQAAVASLVEMLADDAARRRTSGRALASALARVGGGAPEGALGAAAAPSVVARLRRLLDPPPPAPRRVRAAAYAGALALAVAPLAVALVVPLVV